MLYVSPEGRDAWSGTLPAPNADGSDGPLASLARARDAIRTLKKAGPLPGPVTVRVAPGIYTMEKGLELSAEDSGTPQAPIVYEGEPARAARLLGGRALSGLVPVTDQATLARLAPEARAKVLQVDLKAQGISDFGQYRSRGFSRPSEPAALELFFQDRPMTVARWPNQGFVQIAGIPKSSGTGDGHGGTIGALEGGFHYDGDRPSAWKSLDDIWVHGYWSWDWANSYERIASLDTQQRLIKTAPPYALYGFRAGQRMFFQNILEELDEPGEWYLDRSRGVLYFWAPAELGQGELLVSVLESPVISLQDVAHVTLRGLSIEAARGHGVRVRGGEDCRVEDCVLRNLGNYGVMVEGGKGHAVAGCSIYQTGDGGISLSGGDRNTLTPCDHRAENNHIHHVARWSKCYVPAVILSGVGITVKNNLIHDHPHCAVLFSGNEHTIELNEIHHVALETGDVGAIYTGRDWTFRGNVIRHNYIHHTGGVGMGSMGVYMDDCVSGTLIQGNVFHKVTRAVFLGGGRDFRVENNVFVDCEPAVQLDGRGLDKSPVWHGMVYDYMKEHFEAVHPRQPPYSTRYPELAALDKYYTNDDGVPPENIVVARNVCVGGKWLSVGWHATDRAIELKENLVGADPKFVDPGAGNFQLKDDSPAFGLGFQRIPMDRIGLLRGR